MAAPTKKRRAYNSEEVAYILDTSRSSYSGSETDNDSKQFLDGDEGNERNDSEFSVHNISDSLSSHDSNDDDLVQCPSQQAHDRSRDNVNKQSNSLDNISVNYAFTGSPGCKIQNLNAESSALEIFQKFFTHDLILKIAEETNAYADANPKRANLLKRSHNILWSPVTPDEIKAFLAMTVLMGILQKPELDMYWSKDPLLATPFFPETMPRSRFRDILSKLHFNRNENDDQTDRLHKLRPVIDTLAENFRTVYVPIQNISVDESLIKIHGRRVKLKHYNPTKRSRFDIKIYRLNQFQGLASGYTWNFKICTGDEDRDPNDDTPESLHLVLNLVSGLLRLGYNVFIDSCYSSPDLFAELRRQGTNVWGTIRTNRKNGDDTDSSDQFATTYESVRKHVKWYKKVFFYLLDLTISNSYLLQKTLGGKQSLLEFKLSFVRLLLETSALPSYHLRVRPRSLPSPKRLSGRHFLMPIPQTGKKQYPTKRCVVCTKHNKRVESRYQCDSCLTPFCVHPCFKEFHSKLD